MAQVGRGAGDAGQLDARSVQRGEGAQQPLGVGMRGLVMDLLLGIFLLPNLDVWFARETDVLPSDELQEPV